MDIVFLLGRVLFAIMFIRSGIGHFAAKDMMVGYSKSKGAPAPELTVPLSGLGLILGGLMIAFGLWADIGALILVVFLVPAAFIMHAYWKVDDPAEKQADSTHFFKDLALLGAAIFIFWAYNQGQDMPASLTDSLLSPW